MKSALSNIVQEQSEHSDMGNHLSAVTKHAAYWRYVVLSLSLFIAFWKVQRQAEGETCSIYNMYYSNHQTTGSQMIYYQLQDSSTKDRANSAASSGLCQGELGHGTFYNSKLFTVHIFRWK